MGSNSLDSESRSASAVLFVQGISMRISRQDMGSTVYQRGHAGLSAQARRARQHCGFLRDRAAIPTERRKTSPLGLPTKVDLHVCAITLRSRGAADSNVRGKADIRDTRPSRTS